jgi:hypothetical protein
MLCPSPTMPPSFFDIRLPQAGLDWFVLLLPFGLAIGQGVIGGRPFVRLMSFAPPVPKRALWTGIVSFLGLIIGCLLISWYLLGFFALDAWQEEELNHFNQACSIQLIFAIHDQAVATRAWLLTLGLFIFGLATLLCNLASQQVRNRLVS